MTPKSARVPGGLHVLAGGTRKTIKLDRPWQTDVVVDPASCPFESKPSVCDSPVPDWRVLENKYTPLAFHRLIVPVHCWPKERLRSLGGVKGIRAALDIAMALNHSRQQWLGVHVGSSAGQNVAHLHYHLVELPGSRLPMGELRRLRRAKKNVIYEHNDVKVVAGGVRAGQCFLLPIEHEPRNEDWAVALDKIIDLYAHGFRSVQGLPPDYIVGIRFAGRRIVYGFYIPILNQWGFTEYFALYEKTPFLLPWPHAETVRHLKSQRVRSTTHT